jgi:hypothetical protein
MKRWHECILVLVCGFLVAALSAAPAFAQANAVELSGQILDPQGASVAGAKVVVKNLATQASRTVDSNADGRYTFVGLPPGRYELSAEKSGFAKLVNPELVLTIGQAAQLDVHLAIQAGKEVVTVTEAAELIETRRTAVSESVDTRQINNLPINGRNYVNFTLINSQAARDSAPSIGAAPTSGINFSGQRARSNQVSVDGADAVDQSVNGIRSTVSQEAVQEFQLIISNYNAEFGRAMGGVINIVTKGGSNEVHGNLFGFLRHKSLQARNPFSVQVDPATGALTAVKQAYTRAQYGATIGGPIKQDKTFYFFSFEGTRRQETGFTNIGANTGPGTGPFGFVTVPGAPFGLPAGVNLLLTPQQAAFVTNPAVLGAPGGAMLAGEVALLAGSASSVALTGIDLGAVATANGVPSLPGPRFPLPIDCGFIVLPMLVPCTAANLVPLPTSFVPLPTLEGNYPIKEGTSLWSARLDQIWSPKNSTFVRVSVSPSLVTGIQVNAQNQNFGQNAGSRTSLNQYRDVAIVGQHVTSFTNSLFNEFRFQFARRGLHYGFSQLPGGSGLGVQIPGFAFFGREPFSTEDRIERRYQWTDNLTWVKGHHSWKGGVDINYFQLRSKKAQVLELNYGGVANFGGLTPSFLGLPSTFNGVTVPGITGVQAYGLGLPTTYIQGIGNSNRLFNQTNLGFFVQDGWKIHPRLTLNYGVRYDLDLTPQFTPATAIGAAAEKAFHVQEGYPRDYNNVSPRFALAWDPWGTGKTVVRAGYGIFYDHPSFASAFLSSTSDGSLSSQLLIGGGTPSRTPIALNPVAANGASIFQGVLNTTGIPGIDYRPNEQRFGPKTSPFFNNQNFLATGFPITVLPFTLPIAGNFEYAYAQQSNLTIEQQLGHDYKLSVSYTYTHGLKLNRPRNIDSTDPLLLANNFRNAAAAGLSFSTPLGVTAPAATFGPAGGFCGVTVIAPSALGVLNCGPGPFASLNGQFVGTAAFFNFFKPSGPNPSFAGLAGGFANEVTLAGLASYPTGKGVPVPWASVDQQESSGNSVYHALTLNFSKRFANNFQILSSYTWSHAIDDSTDLQTLLEPQDNRFPNRERASSSFDQRHRWVTSAVLQSPYQRGDDGWWRKFLADFTVAPIVEVASGRPFAVLTGTDFRLDFSAAGGRPSVGPGGISSPFLHGVSFILPTVCDGAVQVPPAPVPIPPAMSISPPFGCTGNLGRNTFVRPGLFQWDLRVARKIHFGEKVNLEVLADAFNLFNRFNVADVSPLCNPTDPSGCNAGQPTATLDPRIFQFGLKINF